MTRLESVQLSELQQSHFLVVKLSFHNIFVHLEQEMCNFLAYQS